MYEIIVNPSKDMTRLHIYAVVDMETNDLLFMSKDTLHDIVSLKPLLKFSSFDKSKTYRVIILDSAGVNAFDTHNKFSKWLTKICGYPAKLPKFNNYLYTNKSRAKIRCIETGQIFNTGQEVAKIFGTSPSNLSNHLHGKPGFKSVKGFRFEFYNEKEDFKETQNQKWAGLNYKPLPSQQVMLNGEETTIPAPDRPIY